MLEEFLKRLSSETGSSYIETQKDKEYIFNFLEDIQIDITKIKDTIYDTLHFDAKITPLLEEKKEEILTLVMKANLLKQGSGRAIIGLDENEKFLTLCQSMLYEENYELFKETIEDFLNYLIFWEDEIQKKIEIKPIY